MTYRHTLHSRIRRIIARQEGGALPLVGLAIFAILGSAGAAIDMGRVQIVQSRLSSSLDAAGLAAASSISSTDATLEATKYFHANFPPGYMDSSIESVTVAVSSDNMLLTLDVEGYVETTFMKIFGINSVPVAAHSEITRSNRGMELVLVMDNTGSMGNDNKLEDMKTAATELINIIYGDRETVDHVWVGVIPFAQAVNIGPSRTSWTETDSFLWGPATWAGCVDAREASGRDSTDDPPSVALFPKYYWPCHTSYNAWYGTNSSKNNCQTTPSYKLKYRTLSTSLGPNKSCSEELTPLTKYKTPVLDAIDDMTAVGNTHVNLGAVWGWRMLSPRWRGLWGGEMDTDLLPLDYDAPLMNKVMILLTDGDNTMSNSSHTAYWYLSNGKLGTTNQSLAEAQLNTRLTQVCDSAKSNGVIVYTIAFGNPGSTIEALLEDCATKPEFYFDSPTGEDLQTAFHTIGDSLANLRISK